MNLLCRLGIHHPSWQPMLHRATPWIRIRTCTRCHQPLPHKTR